MGIAGNLYSYLTSGMLTIGAIVTLAFWSRMILHCWKNNKLSEAQRWLWMVAMFVTGTAFPAIVYYYINRKK